MSELLVKFELKEEWGITLAEALAYQDSLLTHIHYVREAARIVGGIPTRQLMAHDESKYTAEEFPFYTRQFFGDKGDPSGWARAWLHHIHHNHHHWQHWVFPDNYTPRGSDVEGGIVQMPEVYVREMVADWMGANRAYEQTWDMAKWLKANLYRIKLHSETRTAVLGILTNTLGYDLAELEVRSG